MLNQIHMSKRVDAEYLEIELDPDTMAEVEDLAQKTKTSPFDMGITLLREALASYEQPKPLG